MVTGGAPAGRGVRNSCTRFLVFSASSKNPSWFMSMVWSVSPRVKTMAWFWFSGLPSPMIAFPGSRTR